jgi:two-component system CheB/CheR fusion protein
LALGDEGHPSAFVKVFRDATPLRFRLDWLENELDEVNAQQRDRDAFLATVAHELRNPLQPIAMAIKLLTHPSDKSRHEHALKVLDRQLSFMQHLIEDLVDMTRVKHAKMAIEYELVELQQLVREAVESCRESAEHNGLILDCVLPPVPVLIEVDPARITQVLVNLLNNAIKFTPRGGKVAVWATVDDGQLIVKVQDTGQGIAADLQPKIFQMFTQANRATTGRGKGLGIGLALVKELVSLHQGSVELRSEGVGKGSEFFIRLPIAAPKGRR